MKLTPAHSFALASLSALPLLFPANAVEIDSSFQASIQGGTVHAIVVTANGILLGGDFTQANGTPASHLVKLGLNGVVNSGFAATSLDSPVYGITQAAGGSIYVSGGIAQGLARLTPEGTLDDTFVIEGNPNGRVQALALAADGSPIVGGSFRQIGNASANFVSHFTASGSIDSAFTSGLSPNFAMEAGVSAMAIQPDGSVIVGGIFDTSRGYEELARLSPDGSVDSTFGASHGDVLYVKEIVCLPNGKILIAGVANSDGSGFVRRLDANGNIDPSFAEASFDRSVECIAVDASGGVIAGGTFTTLNGAAHPYLARLRANGQIDQSWDAQVNGLVSAIAAEGTSKLLVAGAFSQAGNEAHNGVARLILDDGFSFSALGTNTARTGRFVTTLSAEPGQTYIVESSADLKEWSLFSTNTATNTGLEIVDSNTSAQARRFFRARRAN